jgi:hypothetical protein
VNDVTSRILVQLARQLELTAHEIERLATFHPQDRRAEDAVSELNKLVALVSVAFDKGALPESLHTADAIHRARRAYERAIEEAGA